MPIAPKFYSDAQLVHVAQKVDPNLDVPIAPAIHTNCNSFSRAICKQRYRVPIAQNFHSDCNCRPESFCKIKGL